MDLIYKIYSVYLYDNQLNHDWVFFYDRTRPSTFLPSSGMNCDAPYHMFGSSKWCASTKIFNLGNDINKKEKSVQIMLEGAKRDGIKMVKGKDFITLVPINNGASSRISYNQPNPGDIVETEGKYKGLKKQVYAPYDIMWNETKSGMNAHDFEVMGVWNEGTSYYSTYRIWEEVKERESALRDFNLNNILNVE